MKINKMGMVFCCLLLMVRMAWSEDRNNHNNHNNHSNALSKAKPEPILTNSIYNLDSLWTNQEAQANKLSVLRGKTTVMAMAYTSCQSACPILTANMKQIERQLPESIKGKVQFALFSFDHEKDLPAKLKEYAKKQSLDLKQWSLFQGTKSGVQELALVLGVKYKRDSKGDYEHSNVITIVDSEGLIQHQQIGLNADMKETLAVIQKMNTAK